MSRTRSECIRSVRFGHPNISSHYMLFIERKQSKSNARRPVLSPKPSRTWKVHSSDSVFASQVLLFAVKCIRVHLHCSMLWCRQVRHGMRKRMGSSIDSIVIRLMLRRCVVALSKSFKFLLCIYGIYSSALFSIRVFQQRVHVRRCAVSMRVEQTVSRVLEFRFSVNRPTWNFSLALASSEHMVVSRELKLNTRIDVQCRK